MSLDIFLEETQIVEVYWRNITHNLGVMAMECGLYDPLWRPYEIGYKKASDLIGPIIQGLSELESYPDKYKKLNPENGWGDYDGLVEFAREYLKACQEHPNADVWASG